MILIEDMDQETLDSFLSIKGVTGIALLGRNRRPYFFRSFQDLDQLQQEALTLGLFQVLESMPSGFDFFDFQFAQQRVLVYPLTLEWVLLVAVDEALDIPAYYTGIDPLRSSLLQDIGQGTLTFHQLTNPSSRVSQPTPSALQNPSNPVSFNSSDFTEIPIKEMLKAMNHLSQVTTTYLGRAVIVNYWKSARQEVVAHLGTKADLLQQLQVDRSAEICYTGDQALLEPLQHRLLQVWVAAFIKRCEEVIRNFRMMLPTTDLTPEELKLLLVG